MKPDDRPLAHPRTTRILWIGFAVALGLFVAFDFFVEHHPKFGIDGLPGFSAVMGFASSLLIVLIARVVALFLKRPEEDHDD